MGPSKGQRYKPGELYSRCPLPSPKRISLQSALMFVRDLPLGAGVKFNVTCFGSNHKSLSTQCMPYNANTEASAVAWIQANAEAKMGGTEILAVLEHVYNR